MLATENRDIKTKVTVLDAEVSTLKAENISLKQQIEAGALQQLPPFYFTVQNYEQCKEENHVIMSPPFYSYPRGYKMCLQIHLNGYRTGVKKHLTLFVSIMMGEFDDTLQWPFTGRVTIDMYSNKSKQWTEIKVVDFKQSPLERKRDRLTSGNSGYYQFLPQDKVASEYMIKDETYSHVCFRVSRVELD